MSDFRNKVVYQIYPQSFKDTTGNGVGDLQGIISQLDYLHYLGIEMIWLNPIFVSPGVDNGYDITDYCAIDPKFGSMLDFEQLVEEAKKRNIGIMFDMVFNHTSTTHKWFQEALKGNQKYKNYYIFKKSEGHPPTNWESKFGGNAWEYIEDFDEYYLHLFDKTQADLNWENPEVRDELVNILNFWIQKGVEGFRFDVINLISKDAYENDYEGVGKKFYTDGSKVDEYLHEINTRTFGKYNGIMTVGEMSATSIENCVRYTNPNNEELDMVFNFHHLKVDYKDKEKWTLMDFDFKELKDLFNEWQLGMQKGQGWNALFWNCHDQPRSLSRFGDEINYPYESATMLATTTHFLRGTPYIYQGEEIGMTNNHFTHIDEYRDVESINYYNILKNQGINETEIYQILEAKSRDNARSPMQWDSSPQAGFTSGVPWMKVNPNYSQINVQESILNPKSVLQYYRQLISIRKRLKVISEGLYEPLLENHESIYAYKRKYKEEEIVVYNNFYGNNESIEINSSQYDILLSNVNRITLEDNITLKPYESLVIIKR